MIDKRFFMTTVAVIATLVAGVAVRADFVLEYDEDFASDPGWTTDQPGNYYWDAGTETYHATSDNAPPGAPAPPPPPPTRYAYAPINYDGNSMRLTFDMQPTDIQWSAGVHFGLYNHVLATWEQVPETVGARGVYVQLAQADPGRYVTLWVIDSSGVAQNDQTFNVYSEGSWYHFEMAYQESVDEVVLVMTERDTGVPVATLQVAGFGGLPDTLDYLGFARDPSGWNCPSAAGYSCTNAATAYVDNVQFSEEDGLTGGSAVRDLSEPRPFHYCPGNPKRVVIVLDPPLGTLAIALEDTPPAGWTIIQNISDGGSYDPINHKVKWGPFFNPFPTFVSYEVVPPAEASGEQCFVGTLSVDGTNEPITGDKCIDLSCCPYAPADDVHHICEGCADCSCSGCQDGRVELCEVIGYACAWKRGCNDDLAGMTRSAFLWRSGECYCWVETEEQWMSHACESPASGCCGGDKQVDADEESADPGYVSAFVLGGGEPVASMLRKPESIAQARVATIFTKAVPPSGTQASAIEVSVPRGWQVVAVHDGGAWDDGHRKVKWGPFFGDEAITVNFQARRLPIGSHPDEFVGTASFDGTNQQFKVQSK